MTYVVENGGPQRITRISTDGGFIAAEGTGWTYKYMITDYLGHVRSVVAARRDANGWFAECEQRTDFYPYGMAHELGNLHVNRYLFGGKELQDHTIGKGSMLGFYDFHARYYNPVLGRWFNVDPKLQLLNPYLYCANNPVMFVDPDGQFFWLIGAAIGAVINATVAAIQGGDIVQALCTGFISGALGGAAGAGVGGLLASGGSGFIGGAITGAVGGFVGASTNAWMNGASFAQGLLGGAIGGATGALVGGLSRGISAKRSGYSFLRGSKIGGEFISANGASGRNYDQGTLDQMAIQAKSDAKTLWNVRTGENGLTDITTTFDRAARVEGYSYSDGLFVNKNGVDVDGFTIKYQSGNSRVYMSPDVIAARTSGYPSGYSITAGDISNLQVTGLSARYVSALGHELIHVQNWHNASSFLRGDQLFKSYDENSAYTFSKQVWSGDRGMVRAIDHSLNNNGWNISDSRFKTTPMIR